MQIFIHSGKKNTTCICGSRGFKKHYRGKTFEKIHVHCNLRFRIFVKSVDDVFGVCLGFFFILFLFDFFRDHCSNCFLSRAGLADVFCSRFPFLDSREEDASHFHSPVFGHMINVPSILIPSLANGSIAETTPSPPPVVSFHCASPEPADAHRLPSPTLNSDPFMLMRM